MAGNYVAEIEVYAGLEDRDLIAGLRRAEAEVERTTARIDKERADVKIGADLDEFKKKIKEAEAQLKKFDARKADATLSVNQRKYARERSAALAAELAALKKSQGAEQARLATLKTANKEREREADLTAAQAKRDETHAKLLATQEKRRQAAATAEQRDIEKTNKARARAAAQAERALAKKIRESERAAAIEQRGIEKSRREQERNIREGERAAARDQRETERQLRDTARVAAAEERAAIARQKAAERADYMATVGAAKERARIAQLQKQYASLTDQAEKVGKRKAYDIEGSAKLRIDKEGIAAQMEAVKAELNYLGTHPPVEIQVEMERRQSMSRMRRTAAGFGDVIKMIVGKAAGIGDIAIRLGPFTGTIKQFGIALGFLGPILVDLAGAAGSLVGVMGAGLAGASAVGLAGLTGLGFGFMGIKMSMKTAGEELKMVKSATDAYTKAAAKNGAGSKEAKKAHEQMTRVLKGVGPLAREAAKGSTEFRVGWDNATKGTQKSLGSITKGFYGAMKSITPMWAKSTNDLSSKLDTSLKGGFKFLKSGEFKDNFKAITGNFNDSVPNFMRGLGQIGRAFLNIGREGSKFLDPFSRSFERMGDRFQAWTSRSDFGSTIKRWAGYAADLGRFMGALGRVTMHFFGAGAKAGDGFLKSMTTALNRWDKFLTSPKGKNEIADGFERAVDGTKALWNALAPIAGAFITWASNFSPFVAAILKGIGAVTGLASELAKLIGMAGPISALVTAMAALWAVGKIGAFLSMLARIPVVLRQIAAAQGGLAALAAVTNGRMAAGVRGQTAAVAGTAAAAAAASRAGAGAGRRGGPAVAPMPVPRGLSATAPAADKAAGSLSKMGKAANIGKIGLAGLGAIALGVPSVVAGVGIAAVAAGFGIYKWATRTRDWEKSARSATKSMDSFKQGQAGLEGQTIALAGAALQQADAERQTKDVLKQAAAEERNISRLREGGPAKAKQLTAALQQQKSTILAVKDAKVQEFMKTQERTDYYNQERMAIKKVEADVKTALASRKAATKDLGADGIAEQYKKITASGKSLKEAMRDKDPGTMFNTKELLRYEAGLKSLAVAQRAANEGEARGAVNLANLQRGLQGLVPMAQSAGKSLAAISKITGSQALSKKISLKFQDPGQAQRVAQSAAKSLRNGVPKTVTSRIVANSANAEQAVRRLQAVRIPAKTLRIIEKGGKEAIRTVQDLIGRRLKTKEQRIVDAGGANVVSKLRAIGSFKLATLIQNIREAGAEDTKAKLRSVADAARAIKSKEITVTAETGAASGLLNNVAGILSRITSKTVTITTAYRSIGKTKYADNSGGTRMGGPRAAAGTANGPQMAFAAMPNERQLDRAAKTAELSGARRTKGGKYSQPTLLVGEENSSEVVISTNPKYRKRNKGYLRQAASMLGMGVEAAPAGKPSKAKGPKAKGPKAKDKPEPKLGFFPSETVPRKPRFKPASKKGRKSKSLTKSINRGWAAHVDNLTTQQGYWEREIGIRESQVKEPNEMVIRDPANDKPITDPITGEVTTVEAYKANPAIKSSYEPALERVLEAMRKLVEIIRALMSAIPQAMQANLQEQGAREGALRGHNKRIKDAKSAKGKASGDNKDKHQKTIDKHERLRDSENEELDKLKESKKALDEGKVEAGFDYREADIARGKLQNEKDTIYAETAADAAAQSTPAAGAGGGAGGAGGGGAGGGGDQPISINQQTALALTQNANTLKEFGSNFISGTGGSNAMAQFAAGAVAGAGSGMGQSMSINPAALGGTSSGTMSSTSAASGVRSSMSASSAVTAREAGMSPGKRAKGDAGSVSNTNITNNFAAPPPDAHTWSKGVEYELGAIV